MRGPARVVIAILLAIGIYGAGYLSNRHSAPAVQSGSARPAVTYACPMHPQYTSDHPGDCPMCGMRLEPVSGAQGKPGAAGPDAPGVVRVAGASQQLIGVRTEEVRRGTSSQVLRVPGRIAVDEQRLYRIVAAVDGWIVDLKPTTVGRAVAKDQLLASYYTRDLQANERLFLLSIPAGEQSPTAMRDFSQASIRTAGSANPQFPIDALRGIGMSDLQIEEMHKTRNAAPHVNIYSPVSGYVLSRNISPQQRFDKGDELYRIADLSRVWVQTDIFERDRRFLKPGAEATVVYQGQRLKARMSDALPQFDPQSRTLKTRFELDNPDHVLQPEMFVDVELTVEVPPAMTVPSDAVFDAGLRKTVFVDRRDGSFEARRVETGWRLGDRVEIVKGLMEGERVVAAANFLLDSESRMKAVLSGVFDPETDPVCGMEVDGKKAGASGKTVQHDGQTLYFCSDECKHKFEADPAKYLGARQGAAPPAPAISKAASAPMKAAQASSATVKDPVCNMDVDPKDAAGKADYQGKTYYFCSLECKQKFEKNPKQYVK